MKSSTKSACFVTALLLAAFALAGQACLAADDNASCQAFVQKFYDWYIGQSNASSAKAAGPLEVALKTRSHAFSAELGKRLREDVAASAKSPGEIVGLDFDPILNTQEQANKCKAEKVSERRNSFFVDVYSISGGKKGAEPDVQPELTHNNGKWQFVNFHYKIDKKNDDLLHILKSLRDERQKH
jgi:hypothetical protein